VRTGKETAGPCGPTTKMLTSPDPPWRRLVEDNMGAAPMALGIMTDSHPALPGWADV
jgi:hypothetical protein